MMNAIDMARDNWRRLLLVVALAGLAGVGLLLVCGGDSESSAASAGLVADEPVEVELTEEESLAATIEAEEYARRVEPDIQATLTTAFLQNRVRRDEAAYVHPWAGDGSGVLSEADYDYVTSLGPAVFPSVKANLILEELLLRSPSEWADPRYQQNLEWVAGELHTAAIRIERVVEEDRGVSNELRAYGQILQESMEHLESAHVSIARGVELVSRFGSWEGMDQLQREELNDLYWDASGDLHQFRSLLERHGCLACGEVYR